MLLIIVPFYFINGTRHIKLNSLFEVVIRGTHFLAMLAGYYLVGVNGIIYGLIFSTFINIPFQYFYFHRKVIGGEMSFQYFWVIVPVFFLLGLIISENLFFQVSLVLCFLASCKLIYFDPAKQYSKETFLFNRLFSRLENK